MDLTSPENRKSHYIYRTKDKSDQDYLMVPGFIIKSSLLDFTLIQSKLSIPL